MSILRKLFGTDAGGVERPIRVDGAGRVKQSHGQPDPVVGTLNSLTAGNANNFVALNVDGFADFAVYLSGTYAGCTVVLEQSPDSTNGIDGNWFLMAAVRMDAPGTISTTLLSAATNSAVAFNGYAPGAVMVRVRLTARTSGDVAARLVASTASVSPLVGVNGSVAIQSVPIEPYVTSRADTSTNLAASATYTGTGRDLGSDLTRQATRIRAAVRHQAGLTPGTLIFQQSADNSTWIETYRVPVPSDGLIHDFEAALFMRYYRVLFTNGATAQTLFGLWSAHAVAEGNVSDKRTLPFLFSTTPLAANGTFAGPVLDLGSNHDWDEFRIMAFSDQASASAGFAIQHSRDGANWRTLPAANFAAGITAGFTSPVYARYLRAVFVNGATAQNTFELYGVLSPK